MTDYPAIPEPTTDPQALRNTVQQLKEAVEILTGQRGGTQLEERIETAFGEVSARLREIETVVANQTESLARRVTSLESSFDRTRNGQLATSSKLRTVEEALSTQGMAQARYIKSLSSRVVNAEGNIVASATAVDSLTTRVEQTESSITAEAQRITSLETTVGNNSASITTFQSSIDGVSVRFGVIGNINGSTGGFTITGVQRLDGAVAYNFEINGNLIVDGSITSSQLQVGSVGPSQLAPGAVQTGNISSFAVGTGQLQNLAVSHTAFTSSSFTANGNTTLTINISVSGAGANAFVMGSWAQIYLAPTTHQQYEGYLRINGTAVSSAGGSAIDITNTLTGAASLGVGSHSIQLDLRPGTNVQTVNRTLAVWILKK